MERSWSDNVQGFVRSTLGQERIACTYCVTAPCVQGCLRPKELSGRKTEYWRPSAGMPTMSYTGTDVVPAYAQPGPLPQTPKATYSRLPPLH
jgi:hypothetical protein